MRRWLEAVTLPIDQLVLTLAQDIFTEAADLALAHKLALVLRKAADDHTEWRLPELTAELAVIAKNERRFIGFSADDSGFDPEQHRGKVVVTTMHKAKGLEWDRVYLMSVNNYDFPSNQPNDRFISERWFLRNSLNLEAEALAQLNAATSSGEYDWYDEGAATLASAARLRQGAPAPVLRGDHACQAGIDRHLEHRPAGRCHTEPGALRVDGVVGKKQRSDEMKNGLGSNVNETVFHLTSPPALFAGHPCEAPE